MSSNTFMPSLADYNMSSFLKNLPLNERLRDHLCRVYATLTGAIMCAAIGVGAHLVYNIGGLLTSLATIVLLLTLAGGRSPNGENDVQRLSILGLLAFCKGASIGGLVHLALEVDPSVILTAFLGTVTIFACFTLSAMFAKRKSMLYLGGMLSSGVSVMLVLSLMMLFTGSPMIFTVYLYLGLMVFSGYILFDTQLIIERADLGNADYVYDACLLFLRFVAVFVRILVILLRNSSKKNDRNRRRKE